MGADGTLSAGVDDDTEVVRELNGGAAVDTHESGPLPEVAIVASAITPELIQAHTSLLSPLVQALVHHRLQPQHWMYQLVIAVSEGVCGRRVSRARVPEYSRWLDDLEQAAEAGGWDVSNTSLPMPAHSDDDARQSTEG